MLEWIKFHPDNNGLKCLDCTLEEYKSRVFCDSEVVEFRSYGDMIVGEDYLGLGVCVAIFEHQTGEGAWVVVRTSTEKLIEIDIEFRKDRKLIQGGV